MLVRGQGRLAGNLLCSPSKLNYGNTQEMMWHASLLTIMTVVWDMQSLTSIAMPVLCSKWQWTQGRTERRWILIKSIKPDSGIHVLTDLTNISFKRTEFFFGILYPVCVCFKNKIPCASSQLEQPEPWLWYIFLKKEKLMPDGQLSSSVCICGLCFFTGLMWSSNHEV